MNFVTLAFGLILILGGFVALVRKVHDRSIHETVAQMKFAHGDAAAAISAFVGLLAPIVSSIAGGIAFLAVAVMAR
jgi:hypothetical protein